MEILQTRMPTLPMISENPVLLKLLQEVMVIKKMPDGAIRRPRRKTGAADVEQEEEEGTRDKTHSSCNIEKYRVEGCTIVTRLL